MGAWRGDERGDDRGIVNNHTTVTVLGNIQPVGLGEMESSIKPIQNLFINKLLFLEGNFDSCL